MFTSYGHIIKLKQNHQFFYDFRPGHVLLMHIMYVIVHVLCMANK